MENLINKIKKKGYWRVIIRPTEFNEKRIPNKDDCVRIVNESKIVFRGWDYPHIDHRGGIIRSGPDSVASFCDWPEGGHFEYWKFYQNGQFVHYFSMIEDYQITKKEKEKARDSFVFSELDNNVDRFLSIISTLYTITEIHFFAAKLAKLGSFGKETEIIIEFGNVNGRVLFFWGEPLRILSNAYTCLYEPIVEKRVISTERLISDPASFALDFTMDILKEFNWRDPNKNVFIEDQKKLIERRF